MLILASRRGYLPDVKQTNPICFQTFRAIIPLLLLINSLPGARGREAGARKKEERLKTKRGETAKDRDLLSCFQEFRELLL